MTKPEPSPNDPTSNARKEDASFLPVVIISGIAIVVILLAAIFLIKGKKEKVVGPKPNPHPTSLIIEHPSAINLAWHHIPSTRLPVTSQPA